MDPFLGADRLDHLKCMVKCEISFETDISFEDEISFVLSAKRVLNTKHVLSGWSPLSLYIFPTQRSG